MITENLSTLKIHSLTADQLKRIIANGEYDNKAIYLTPDEDGDFVTETQLTAMETSLKQYIDNLIGSILNGAS